MGVVNVKRHVVIYVPDHQEIERTLFLQDVETLVFAGPVGMLFTEDDSLKALDRAMTLNESRGSFHVIELTDEIIRVLESMREICDASPVQFQDSALIMLRILSGVRNELVWRIVEEKVKKRTEDDDEKNASSSGRDGRTAKSDDD